MAAHQVIHIHPDAPPKPREGQPCNGCGVCCLAEPCPVGMVVSLKRHGTCRALRWSDEETRYLCGLMIKPGLAGRLIKALAGRWIAAGIGCDSSLEPQGQTTSREGKTRH